MNSRNGSSIKYRRAVQTLYILGGLLSVFFTASVLTSYDKNMHYFALGDVKPVIYTVCAIVLCVAALLTKLLIPKGSILRGEKVKNHKSPASFVCGILCLIAMLAVAFSRFSAAFGAAPVASPVSDIASKLRTLNILLIVFAVLSALFFLFDMLHASAVLRSFLGFAVVGFFIVYLLCIYYDTEIPINSPMRILDQVSVIASLMWFLLEERNLLRQSKPYLYVALGIMSFTFSVSLSVSTLLAAGLDKMNAGKYACIGAFLLLVFAAWSITRVHSLIKAYCTENS